MGAKKVWGAPIFHLTELWFTTHNIVSKLTESYKMTTPTDKDFALSGMDVEVIVTGRR